MEKRITLQELIAFNNTPKAKALVIKYGYSPARSYNDLIKKLNRFTSQYKGEALKELAELHPHKDLILNYFQPDISNTEMKSNCDGNNLCSKCLSEKNYISFEGNNTNNDMKSNKFDFKETLPVIALTSLITAILVIGLKNS